VALGRRSKSGRIWTAAELMEVVAIPRFTKAQAKTVARAKCEFNGDVVAVYPARPAQSDGHSGSPDPGSAR
jgi:hypothetical protein